MSERWSSVTGDRFVRMILAGFGLTERRKKEALFNAEESFARSYIANLVTAGVRLIPLGQTEGQTALLELEEPVLAATAQAKRGTIADLGSAAFIVDLASMEHETQYTRLFRS